MAKSSNIDIIKFNIKQQIKEKNKTIEEVCKVLGRSRYHISKLQDGTPIHKIIDIAYAIGCEPSELFKGL